KLFRASSNAVILAVKAACAAVGASVDRAIRCGAPAPGFGFGFGFGFGALTTICGSCAPPSGSAACSASCCDGAAAGAEGLCCCCAAGDCCALAPSTAVRMQSATPLGGRPRSTRQRANPDTVRCNIAHQVLWNEFEVIILALT